MARYLLLKLSMKTYLKNKIYFSKTILVRIFQTLILLTGTLTLINCGQNGSDRSNVGNPIGPNYDFYMQGNQCMQRSTGMMAPNPASCNQQGMGMNGMGMNGNCIQQNGNYYVLQNGNYVPVQNYQQQCGMNGNNGMNNNCVYQNGRYYILQNGNYVPVQNQQQQQQCSNGGFSNNQPQQGQGNYNCQFNGNTAYANTGNGQMMQVDPNLCSNRNNNSWNNNSWNNNSWNNNSWNNNSWNNNSNTQWTTGAGGSTCYYDGNSWHQYYYGRWYNVSSCNY